MTFIFQNNYNSNIFFLSVCYSESQQVLSEVQKKPRPSHGQGGSGSDTKSTMELIQV